MGNEIVKPNDEMLNGVARLEQWGNEIQIVSQDDYAFAAERIKGVKQMRKSIVDFFADTKSKAHDTWKAIVAQEKSFTDKLDAVEKSVKRVMITFTENERRKMEAERQRLQAIADEQARKEREKAEQAAEKQRAIEAAARFKAEKLRKEGDEKAAAAAERKAAAAAVKVEAQTEAAASVIAPVVEICGPEKVSGTSTTKRWKARLTIKDMLIKEAATNDLAASLLIFDQQAANRLATATKGSVKIPGVEFYTEESVNIRTK